MDKSKLKHFYSLKEAQFFALYKSFVHRLREEIFVAIPSYKGQYTVVLKADALERGCTVYEPAPDHFTKLSIQEIEDLIIEENPIEPFRELNNALSIISPEILSFMIQKNLPLEKFVQMYLVIKGYNKLGQMVDYDVAKMDWTENL